MHFHEKMNLKELFHENFIESTGHTAGISVRNRSGPHGSCMDFETSFSFTLLYYNPKIM